MQILEVLKQDHREVQDLLEQLSETSERAAKKRLQLFEKIRTNLLAHAHAEQRVFYDALKEHEDAEDMILEAEIEHRLVEQMLNETAELEPADKQFMAHVSVLLDLVAHHVKEEEKEIFKIAREHFERQQLNEMGEEMETEKEQEMEQVKAA